MINAASGERLSEIFLSDRWQQHLVVLSNAVGFSLSVYSSSGALLAATDSQHTCAALLSSSLHGQCVACSSRLAEKTLTRRRPVLSKCHARIICFAIPLSGPADQAVVMGRGAFASYRDFRAFLSLAEAASVDRPFRLEGTLRFITVREARRACSIVSSSVEQLLKNEQENSSLRQRMQVLQEVMGRWDAASSRDAVTVYDQLMTSLLNLLEAKQVLLFFHDRLQAAYTPLYGRARGNGMPVYFPLAEDDAVVRLLQEQKPYVVSSEPVIGVRRDLLRSGEACWFFPLRIRGELEGIVGLTNGTLTESDVRIVTALCSKAAMTVENLRLHEDLHRKFERFSATVETAKALAPIRGYDALLQSILSKSADLLRAERGSLMLLERETDTLLLEAQKGVIEGISERMRIPKGEGIAGKVAQMGEPLLVQNLENDPRVRQKNRGHYKTRSFLSVPLKIGDRTIGVLNLSDKVSGEVFTEDDLQLIQSFAHHAVVVLERNVLYTQTERLKKLSITDPLTGLLNRRYF